jgi:hypothetical protein
MAVCDEPECIVQAEQFNQNLQAYKQGVAVTIIYIPLALHIEVSLIEELIDITLLHYYDDITTLIIASSLPDSVGMKIAELIHKSKSIICCNISHNAFSHRVMRAVAHALYRNTSLEVLVLHSNRCHIYSESLRREFMTAAWVNPNWKSNLQFRLNEFPIGDNTSYYRSLRSTVETWGHPPLYLLIQHYLDSAKLFRFAITRQ